MCIKYRHIVAAQETQASFKPVPLSSLEDFSKEETRTEQRWEVDQAWLSPSSCSQVTSSPGSHDRGQKAAPASAPTTGLVRADTGGTAGPRRGPYMVPRCHLERVRTHTPSTLPFTLFLCLPPPWAGFHSEILGSGQLSVLGEWKKLWSPGLESCLFCELAVCPWASYFPSLDLSFLYTSGHQTCTARTWQAPHSPLSRPGIINQWR